MSYFIDHRNQQQNKEGVKTQRRADSRDPPEEENLPDLTRGSKLWAKFTATIKRNKTQEGAETKLLKPPEKTKNVKRCGRKKIRTLKSCQNYFGSKFNQSGKF